MFYTPEMAVELGLGDHGDRCHDLPGLRQMRLPARHRERSGTLRELYLEAEDDDGYLRDKCVFADDITIEDTMQVQVRYANDVFLNYTLCAYSPWEGLEIKFHGTKGELTHRHIEVHGVFGGQRDKAHEDNMTTTLHLAGERAEEHRGLGRRGRPRRRRSGDAGLPVRPRPAWRPVGYNRASSHQEGAWSILTGIAASKAHCLAGNRACGPHAGGSRGSRWRE